MRKNEGQTILEVLIALSLIIIFLSGIVIVELVSLRNIQFGQNKSIAAKLANQQLERARVMRDSVGADILLNNCSGTCYINSNLTPIINPTPGGIYSQTLSVSSGSFSDCPQVTPIYKLTSSVSWKQNATVTIFPPPQVALSTCMTDWR